MAQWISLRTLNQKVRGSNPCRVGDRGQIAQIFRDGDTIGYVPYFLLKKGHLKKKKLIGSGVTAGGQGGRVPPEGFQRENPPNHRLKKCKGSERKKKEGRKGKKEEEKVERRGEREEKRKGKKKKEKWKQKK